ncbi:hypothetical protein T440DRAFT_519644 [Plenodomus tracheiphilus IPT5]|uniref:Copper transport protein n=1 Tax=Plenodomus tracheiphilus IPT5 TaxID=1408161 RepID=A0A6A7AZN1_9PLEO|nr:hypothetical protein T440DRAFT_519644 [Plenodomus tracheiphilus IPT5]
MSTSPMNNMPAPSSGSLTSAPSMDTMSGMSGMSSTFSSSTRVTLWVSDWTTTSTATYVLTIFFLFALGMLNRLLGALKSQLEMKWKAQRESAQDVRNHEKSLGETVRGHARQWSRALRQQQNPIRLVDQDGQETEPLSPTTQSAAEIAKPVSTPMRQFWVANAPWSLKKDGISAGLEFSRALIGYVLMLAVMTYNIGFLFAVTGSVLLGELVFGRYTRGSAGIAEDGCHS